jgi:very-short-patch-repair endonuclease
LDYIREEVERLQFVEGMSLKEIAQQYGLSTHQLSRFCDDWGLTKEIRKRGLRSDPQVKLKRLLLNIFPNTIIESEHHIGEHLYLDFYLPRYRIAFEYDGIQHNEYVEYFHKDEEGFRRAQERDARKEEICYAMGIILVRLGPSDELSEDNILHLVRDKLFTNGDRESPELPYKERIKRLSREAKRARMRALYQMSKKKKKGG